MWTVLGAEFAARAHVDLGSTRRIWLRVGRAALSLHARAVQHAEFAEFINLEQSRSGNLDLLPRVLFWQSLARCLGVALSPSYGKTLCT